MGKNILNIKSEKEYKKAIAKGNVIVDFWAKWCGPCRTMEPMLDDLNDVDNDVTVVKVNTDDNLELATNMGIRSIPAMKMYRDGVLIETLLGVKSESDLLKVFGK